MATLPSDSTSSHPARDDPPLAYHDSAAGSPNAPPAAPAQAEGSASLSVNAGDIDTEASVAAGDEVIILYGIINNIIDVSKVFSGADSAMGSLFAK
jgi:hypothetical protein